MDNGLLSSTIYAAFQDSKGFMWFCSDLGVAQYDGYDFTHYTTRDGLADNEVFNFFEDSSGRIWFQTLNGKVSYYYNGGIVNSKTDSTLSGLNSESAITGMYEDSAGNLWISSLNSGIIRYSRDGRIIRFLQHGEVTSIHSALPGSSGGMTLITRYGVYAITFNSRLDAVVKCVRLSFSLHEDLNKSIGFSKSITLGADEILFSNRGSIYSGNVKANKFEVFLHQSIDTIMVYNICKDNENVWVCTDHGVIGYSMTAKEFAPPFLKDHKISSVLRDREGNYWVTTLGDGVFFSSSKNMYGYTVKDGLLSDKITCLAKDTRNRVWFGYEKGAIGHFSEGKVNSINITSKPFLNTCKIFRIFFSGSKCWVASSLGLFLLENGRIDAACCNYKTVIEYPENVLWLGSSDQIVSVDRRTFEKFKIESRSVPVGYHTGIRRLGIRKKERAKAVFLDSDKTIWISTDKHLYRLEGDSMVCVLPEKFKDQSVVNSISESRNKTLLLATSGRGLTFMDPDGETKTIGEEDGLSSNICSAVYSDEDGDVWVATNNGLNKISGYPDKIRVDAYTIYDGLLSNEITDVLVVNDTVWAATKKGISFFHKDQVKRSVDPPPIYITQVMVNGKPADSPGEDAGLILEHNENDISISYGSLQYNSVGAITYRYRLHRGAPWRFTQNRFVHLPELSWGNYEFVVEAKGRSGVWSEASSLVFVIKKPFWKTWLFIAATVSLIIVVITAIAYTYFRHQSTKFELQQRVTLSELRSLRAQMNPHFLFNALNSIQDLFLRNTPETAQDYLSKFGRLLRSILDHSNKVTVSLAEEIGSLRNYLELEQLRTSHRFKYSIEVSPQIDMHVTEIPAMMLQPFVENAIWHGLSQRHEGGELCIRFEVYPEGCISIQIEDNGVGLKRSMALNTRENHKSRGIQLVRERIDILNATNSQKVELRIVDREESQHGHSGTTVRITIPLI